jgi:hypothetical protein
LHVNWKILKLFSSVEVAQAAFETIKHYNFTDDIIVWKSVSDILLVGKKALKELKINIMYTTAGWGPFCDRKFFSLATEIKCKMVFCSIDNVGNIFQNPREHKENELIREGPISEPNLSQVYKTLKNDIISSWVAQKDPFAKKTKLSDRNMFCFRPRTGMPMLLKLKGKLSYHAPLCFLMERIISQVHFASYSKNTQVT